MRFEEFGNEVKEVRIATKPHDLAENNIYFVLSNLLGAIKKEYSEIFDQFIEKTSEKLRSLLKERTFEDQKNQLSKTLKQHEHLEDKLEFVKDHLNYFIGILGITETQFWENEKSDYAADKFMYSLYALFYVQLESLIELLTRDKAIKFYRKTVDNYNQIYNAIHQKGWYSNLTELREKQTKWLEKNPYGRFRIYSEVKNGQLIRICRNCEKYDSLKNSSLVNKEIVYEVLCYMHIPLARVWNDHFNLSIMKSKALGDPYCAYVYTDEREVEKVELPTNEFLDGIWQKKK